MAVDLRTVAHLLGGDVISGGVSFAPPGHSRADRSARLFLGPQYVNGFWVTSFAGDDELALRDYVAPVLGLPGFGEGRREQPDTLPRHRVSDRSDTCRAGATDDAARTARALALWAEGRDPAGTPAETYLARRGLTLPAAGGDVLRWHPACPFAGQRTGAMLALVRGIQNDKPQAVHRTALTIDGHKVKVEGKDRLALGPLAGGAVKITPDAEVTLGLGVAEGVESALSLALLDEWRGSPVWSLISAGGIASFPVLSGIEVLWIGVDHDPAGMRAAEACADRWTAAGREVFLVEPKHAGADLNNIVMQRRAHS